MNSVYKFRFAIENKIIFLNWFILVDLIQIIIAKIYLIIFISYSFFIYKLCSIFIRFACHFGSLKLSLLIDIN